jgi:hypothetical protein
MSMVTSNVCLIISSEKLVAQLSENGFYPTRGAISSESV